MGRGNSREGGARKCVRTLSVRIGSHPSFDHPSFDNTMITNKNAPFPKTPPPDRPRARPRAGCRRLISGAAPAAALREDVRPPPPSRTKWTRRVPHPVLIGHAASLSQARAAWEDGQHQRGPPAHRPARAQRGPRPRSRAVTRAYGYIYSFIYFWGRSCARCAASTTTWWARARAARARAARARCSTARSSCARRTSSSSSPPPLSTPLVLSGHAASLTSY
jgi:hypothetical protein